MKYLIIVFIVIITANANFLQVNDRYFSGDMKFSNLGKAFVCGNDSISVKEITTIRFVSEIPQTTVEDGGGSKMSDIGSKMTLYPNPFNPELSISANTVIREIRIYDCMGKNVASVKPMKKSWVWSPKAIGAGTYTITAITNGRIISKKAVLLK